MKISELFEGKTASVAKQIAFVEAWIESSKTMSALDKPKVKGNVQSARLWEFKTSSPADAGRIFKELKTEGFKSSNLEPGVLINKEKNIAILFQVYEGKQYMRAAKATDFTNKSGTFTVNIVVEIDKLANVPA